MIMNSNEQVEVIADDTRPTTPNNYHQHQHQHQHYNNNLIPFNSPNTSTLLNERTPSPTPRDDIIEGMSLSTSSIFERDVEHFEATLTAQDAIQLAVPPVLDEAIEALATLPTEQIMVDQIPLQVHLFNNPSTVPIDSTPSSPVHSSSSPPPNLSNNSINFNRLYQTSPISSPGSVIHQRTTSIPSYPFPTSSDLQQPNPSATNYPSSKDHHGAPPSPPIPRFHRQPMSCTSDTASISDPSSPRSLSPTPSFMVGRSMFTQLADQEPTQTLIYSNQPISEISSDPTMVTKFIPPSTTLDNNNNNQPPLRQRKTCISFMSYVDVLNSERAPPDLSDSPAPLSSALNALRMARKSTSSLVKRASSIFSHPSRRRGTSTNKLGNESMAARGWSDRSRCTSTNSNYHSCPTHQPTIGESDQIFPHHHSEPDNQAEVLSHIDWN